MTADYVYIRSLGYFYPFLFIRLYLEKEKRYDADIFTIWKETKLYFIIDRFLISGDEMKCALHAVEDSPTDDDFLGFSQTSAAVNVLTSISKIFKIPKTHLEQEFRPI